MSYPVFMVPAGDVLPVMFASYAGSTGASATLTGLLVSDIEIYKDGSTTQRASDAGYALLDTDGIDFDGITGIHGFSIDTGDNTDSGFYTVGAWFTVVVSAVTVDSQTVNFIACQFRLMPAESVAGKPKVDTDTFGGSAGTFSSGRPEVNTTHIAGSAVSTSSAQIGVNVVNAGGTAWGSGAITAASIAADAITDAKVAADVTIASVTGAVGSVTGNVGGNVVGSVGSVVGAVGSVTGAVGSVTGLTASDVAAIKAKTDNLPSDPADASDVAAAFSSLQSHGDSSWATATGFSILNAAGVRAALGMASADLDTQLAALPTAVENADALIGRNIEGGSSSGRTVAQALAFIRNKWSISAGTLTVCGVDDSTTSWTAAVTQTSGNPVSAVDPA